MATALGALLLTLTLLFFNLNLARGSSRAPLDVDIDVKYPKPTALGDGATRPLCVTVARNVSVSVSEPAQTGTRFIVVYGEVERVVTTLGGGGNASLVVERVVQVFDGDSLKLLQESVDSQPALTGCSSASAFLSAEDCRVQCAAFADEAGIALQVLDASHVRDYTVDASGISLEFSVLLSVIEPSGMHRPGLAFNSFRRMNTLYFGTSNRLQLHGWTSTCGTAVCFSKSLEYEVPLPSLALFFTDPSLLVIASVSFEVGEADDELLALITLENRFLHIRDLSEPWESTGEYLQLPLLASPDVAPALVTGFNNDSLVFVAEGSKTTGTRATPHSFPASGVHLGRLPTETLLLPELGFQDANPPMFLASNTIGLMFTKSASQQVALSTLEAGQRYLFITDLFSTEVVDFRRRRMSGEDALTSIDSMNIMDSGKRTLQGGAAPTIERSGQVFPMSGPSQMEVFHPWLGKVSTVQVYAFTPTVTGSYMLNTVGVVSPPPFLTELWAYFPDVDVPGEAAKKEEDLVMCCFFFGFTRIAALNTPEDIRVITAAEDGSMQVWNPKTQRQLESVLLPSFSGDVEFLTYRSAGNAPRIVSFSTQFAGMEVWAIVESEPPSFTDLYVLVFNVVVYLSVAVFVVAIVRLVPRYQDQVRDQKRANTSYLRSFLAAIGLRRSFRKFDTYQLTGYAPERIFFGRLELNKCLLIVYLLFVLVFFTPGILISADDFMGGSATCSLAKNKLSAIQQQALKDLHFFPAMVEIEEREVQLQGIEEEIDDIRVSSGNALFTNFPNGSSELCSESLKQEYEEAQRLLTSLCDAKVFCLDTFAGLDVTFEKEARWFFERNNNIFVETERTCVPDPGTKVPCPIDTSVIDDLLALETLLERHQDLAIPSLPQVVEHVEQRIIEEINYVVWLITLASQVYIGYSIIIILLGIPLRLYHSGIVVRVQRTFFATSQLTFVIVVVLAMWIVPFLFKTLSFENIRLYLHNIYVDPCYTKPTFLGQIANEIVSACAEVDNLEQRYYSLQYQTRDINTTANQYRECDAAQLVQYNALDVFSTLDAAAEAMSPAFNATTCGQDTMRALVRKYVVAPGGQQHDFIGLFYSIGLILQLFPGLIFARFGISYIRTVDPLLLHDGLVEIEGEEDDHTKLTQDEIAAGLPTAGDITLFLYEQRLPGLLFNGMLVFLYMSSFIRLLAVDPQQPDLVAELCILLIPLVLVCVVVCCASRRRRGPDLREQLMQKSDSYRSQ